jgi:predicted ATPase/class 3 adenylate cyclase
MAELPTGTVTFLFTDIEGSTRLLQELGDRYPGVQDEHAAIVGGAIEGAGGVVARIEGDAFFAAFRSPGKAVEAAVAAQRGLAAHEWSHGDALRVRMGIHTGDGVPGGGDYVGIDVNRAARIAEAAHGGQILLSQATRSLVEHGLPEGASLRDLGEHRLKDIAHSEHLHDVTIQGLRADFPPPRTIDARPNNLPVQLSSFVGREEEIAEVRRLLDRSRLLTLTGAGGTGKTRLALQVAAEVLPGFAGGAFFVDLSTVTDDALVPSAVARALDVPEVPGRPLLESVKDHLRTAELLLVIDNVEQVLEARPVVQELLGAAPNLRVVVTSRVALSVGGEQEYEVPPLELPDPERLPDLATLCRLEAMRLFTERAVAVSPGFRVTEGNAPAVAEITARLDGLPLAIELAASRTKLLTPEEMVRRMEQRLAVLTSGGTAVPERQRTLRGAIAWSYELLDAPERRLFARLSVFSGGWTLASAEAVCRAEELGLDPVDGLSSLVDKSLVRRVEPVPGQSRFSMLETIREFGQEQLREQDDADVLRRRHGEHFLDLAVAAEPHLLGAHQAEWLDRCEREHANIRAALRWAIDAGEAGRAQEAAGGLWRFWQHRGHLAEARSWFEEVLAMPEGQARTPARAKALTGAGGIAWWQADLPATRALYDEALAIEREGGDPGRIAEALYNESYILGAQGEVDAAVRSLDESLALFRRVGDEPGVARVLSGHSLTDAMAGNWDAVIARQEEALAVLRRVGDRFHLADALAALGVANGRVGRASEARSHLLEALQLFQEAENITGVAAVLLDLSFVAAWEGRSEDALRLGGAWETVREAAGGGPPSDFLGALVGDPHAEARAELTEEAAERAWEEGRALSIEAALGLAREEAGYRGDAGAPRNAP